MLRTILLSTLTIVILSACGGVTADPVIPGAGATVAQISECKEMCDKQKFFDCYDASAHSVCYSNCAVASTSQIEAFNGCVRSSICDAECGGKIKPTTTPPVVTPPTTDTSSCKSACTAYGKDGCPGATECAATCDKASADERFALLYCMAHRTKCEFSAECKAGGETDPVEGCRHGCDQMATFGCLAAVDQAKCRDLCGSVEASKRDNFTACANGGICANDSCYKVLNPAGAGPDVTGCQDACDRMKFFDCVSAAEQSTCRSHCSVATSEAIKTFKGCVGCASEQVGTCFGGMCTDGSCFDAFK